MSMLGKLVQEARSTAGGENLRDGDYLFGVDRLIEIDGYEGKSFIGELLVLEATQIDDKVQPNKVGSTVSVVYNATKNKAMALGNIKALFVGLLGVTEDEVTAELYDRAIDEDEQPFRGMRVGCRTFHKINQGRENPANKGQVLVLPKWSTIDQTPEQVAKWREAMGKPKPKYEPPADAPAKPPADAPAPTKRNAGMLAGILGAKK